MKKIIHIVCVLALAGCSTTQSSGPTSIKEDPTLVPSSPLAGEPASSQEPSQGPYYGKRPPFSADELWAKILLLLREQGGYVTKQRFEEVFGVQFSHVRNLQGTGKYVVYSMKHGTDWYFAATLDEIPAGFEAYNGFKGTWYIEPLQRSWFSISWPDDLFGDKNKNECLSFSRVAKDVAASGWGEARHARHHSFTPVDEYDKNGEVLRLYLDGSRPKCISYIQFGGKHP